MIDVFGPTVLSGEKSRTIVPELRKGVALNTAFDKALAADRDIALDARGLKSLNKRITRKNVEDHTDKLIA